MTIAAPSASPEGNTVNPSEARAPAGVRGPQVWTSTTYFAEGFPYGAVVNLADLFFVSRGASLEAVGLTSLFHLPWNLKFLVGPFVDAYATKRRWLIAIEVLLTAALALLAFFASLDVTLMLASVMFLVLGVLSATHDIAIDGLYLEALDKDQQARFVGYRAPAYRVALLVITGPIAWSAQQFGWASAFAVVTAVMGLLLGIHVWVLPRTEQEKLPFRALGRTLLRPRVFLLGAAFALLVAALRTETTANAWGGFTHALGAALPAAAGVVGKWTAETWIAFVLLFLLVTLMAALPWLKRRLDSSQSFYASAFVSFLAQPYAARILAFVVLFRVGESFLMKMKYPFCSKMLGVTLDEWAIVNGTFGMVASLFAPALGGYLIAKGGLKKFIWPFTLAQNGLHLLFVAAALAAPSIVSLEDGFAVFGVHVSLRLLVIIAIVVVEMVGAGLGTAVLMVYLMRCALPQHRAAHMAILTALMSVSFTLAGVLSGFLADAMGFAAYFAFTFVVTVPGMALMLFIPHVRDPGAPPAFGVNAADATRTP